MPRRQPLDVEIIEVLDHDDLFMPEFGAAPQHRAADVTDARAAAARRRAPWILAGASVLVLVALSIDWTGGAAAPPPSVPVTVAASLPLAGSAAGSAAGRTDHDQSFVAAEGRFVFEDESVTSQRGVDLPPTTEVASFRAWAVDGRSGAPVLSVEVERVATPDDVHLPPTPDAPPVGTEDWTTERWFTGGWRATIRTHGLAADVAVPLAKGIRLDTTYSGRPVPSLADDLSLPLTLEPVASADRLVSALFGTAHSQVLATRGDGAVLTLWIAHADLEQRVLNLHYLADAVQRRDDGIVLARLWTGERLAMWEEAGHVLSLVGTEDADVARLAMAVRPASIDEWQAITDGAAP